jgi:hypothetical protein
LDALERASRFQYLLGYYPSAGESSRRIRVVVNRPDATVLHRNTFQSETGPEDVENFHEMVAVERIDDALESLRTGPRSLFNGQSVSRSQGIRVSASAADGPSPGPQMKVSVAFDPGRLAFAQEGGHYRATIYAAVTVEGANGDALGDLLRKIDVAIPEHEFARTRREWIAIDLEIVVSGDPRNLRAAIYNYDSDRVLAAGQTIRPSH